MNKVKFYLYLNGIKIRSLEELREHINTQELIFQYKNKLLHKWLFARGYKHELELLNLISSDEDVLIVIEICKILKIKIDENIKESIEKWSSKEFTIIDDKLVELVKPKNTFYLNNYQKVYQDFLFKMETVKDLELIKVEFNKFIEHGENFFEYYYKEIFKALIENNFLALCYLFCNNVSRKYFIRPDNYDELLREGVSLPSQKEYDIFQNELRVAIFNIFNGYQKDDSRQFFGKYLKHALINTHGNWKELESCEKPVLFLYYKKYWDNSLVRVSAPYSKKILYCKDGIVQNDEECALFNGLTFSSNDLGGAVWYFCPYI